MREILHAAQDPGGDPADPPQELPGAAVEPDRSPIRLPRRPQRLALAVNLLLVLVIGVLVGRIATYDREPVGTPPATTAPAATTAATATAATALKAVPGPVTSVTVPASCVETAELADEVISRLNRNVRDRRLFVALRDYTIASQACRRAARP